MRVSDNMKIDTVTRSIAGAQARQLTATREASSGLKVSAPSDDPVAAARLARLSASIESTAAYRSSISMVQGDVELAESTFASATSIMERAQEIALQGANGALSNDARTTMAGVVAGLKQQLIALANT
jgi:flagellar hook-associated protein 3 FlgL